MKLVTFVRSEAGSKPKIGAWVDGDIVDIEAALRLVDRSTDSFAGSLRLLIAAGANGLAMAKRGVDAAVRTKAGDGIRWPREDVRLLPPILDPNVFFCVGKNNKSHLEELVRNQLIKEIPKEPTGFVKLNSVMVGDGAAVVRPNGITTLDYEPELTFVIGKRAFGVASSNARAYVAGITLTNDSKQYRIDCVYWYVDYYRVPALPQNSGTFHAQYRQEYPCKRGEDYLILDTEGRKMSKREHARSLRDLRCAGVTPGEIAAMLQRA